jgi:FkbM family methyltransferase
MYDQFRWTNLSARRNRLTMEYEPVQPFFLLALAEAAEARTFVDVGSNIGVYALFATLVPSVTNIVAFEPNAEAARELRANIALNRLGGRIEVDERAVSNGRGILTFGIVSRFSGANSVVDTSIHNRSNFHKELQVEAISLDDLFDKGAASPLCLKIDVEGHEAEVLEGARGSLRNSEAVIQIEEYDGVGNGGAGILDELGFSCVTAIGPDRYYSNMERFRDPAKVVKVYERALAQLIAYNHSDKAVLLKRGDFALQLTGKSATVARELAKRIAGKRL